MPNWCSNTIVVYGNSNEVKRFHEGIEEEKNLYTYFEKIGFTQAELEKMHLRAQIECVELVEENETNSHVKINYESAWSPCIEEFNTLLAKYYPTLNQVSIAEECGCEIYINTDTEGKYFIDKYYIDTCINGEYWSEYYGYGQEDLLVKHYNNLRHTTFTSIEEVINDAENFESDNEDDFINIHEFTNF